MTAFLLDVDTGIDDALALAYLAALPDSEFVSVTATPGNVDADQVARNTLALLEQCGRPGVEVAVGARKPLAIPLLTTPETHGPQGIGYAVLPEPEGTVSVRNAVDLWVEHARARPGELTALITAPLTNFALALRKEPRLPELLAKVVIMGGSFYHQGNTTPTAEWNTHVDPHAAKEVYAAFQGRPLEKLPIVCSLDTTERMELHPEHVRQLAEAAGATVSELVLPDQPEGLRSTSDNTLVRHLSDALRFYFEFHRHYDQGYLAHVHDYFAAGVAAGTLDFEARPASVDVETGSQMLMGTTVADFRGLWGVPPNARVVSANHPEAAFRELVSAVGSLARRLG
ncbi:inosine-uridine preferring nucleoside hydrolase family protein [Pseudarthrobacter siccitolerans]|uniref:Inosine-uridine preferring nucleoside hydrolase family protein n=1 Tax=Pseudarthrobacter siccitolerans TaxID=861266 RepID=A0A024H339_9MICC|nr:nucleoside hydrolase [Pseudarthrobacter siccitolerans]CCQ46580.1 inosine-uridine preferring nucleoside hydrolase family protein [Pseudarthrobacter siccitolerans]